MTIIDEVPYWVPIPLFVFFLKGEFGAGEGIRTLDPNLGKVVLYH